MDGDAHSHKLDFPQNWLGSLPVGPQHLLLQLLCHHEYDAPIHSISLPPASQSWVLASILFSVASMRPGCIYAPSMAGFPQTASPLNRHPLFPRNQASWSAFTMTVKYLMQHSKEKLKRQWKTMTGTANQSMQCLFSLHTIISSCRPFMLRVYSIIHTHN